METVIYFYTGTGNSLWAARQLASLLGGAELVPMTKPYEKRVAKRVGLVFPVHMWGVPGAVLGFISRLDLPPDAYCFAAAVNAGEVSNTLIQLEKQLKKRGIRLSAGIDIVMPSNYVPWGGPGPDEELQKICAKAGTAVKEAAEYIASGKSGRMDKGPLWQRIVYTLIYHSAFKWVNYMDKNFWADDKCNSCGICEKVCPAKNITLVNGRPVWNKKCQQCLACIQWCPVASIQYGKKTPLYPRYHHKSVNTADMSAIAAGDPEGRFKNTR
jgi:ferredoxin